MRAVMLDVPESLLEARRRVGADRWDEMWEGVLHMSPAPRKTHQRIEGRLHTWLSTHLDESAWEVLTQRNVAQPGAGEEWVTDYRIPDLVAATPKRDAEIERDTHTEGAPELCVEVRTPGDESYDKLPFYFAAGAVECWIIDRDSLVPQLFVRGAARFEEQPADDDGWLTSALTGVRLREDAGKLLVQVGLDAATRRPIP